MKAKLQVVEGNLGRGKWREEGSNGGGRGIKHRGRKGRKNGARNGWVKGRR